jgi:hypothetical protein
MNLSYLTTISLIFLIFLASCSSKKNENDEIVKKELKNPNLVERAKENAAKNPIFDSSRKKNSGTFEFSTSNVLWRATLKTLDFIPLNNTDYSGGMIVTDWYGNSSEQIKISVQFLSNELSSTSIKVVAHKKKCKENNCFTEPANESFNIEIKDKILNEARAIKIDDDKNKK